MGGFGAFISGVCSAVSTVVSGVANVCSKIGESFVSGSIGKAITGIISPLPMGKIGAFIRAVEVVSVIVTVVAELLGIKEKEEEPEELAMKAEQAEKKPEDFESTKEYIDYIRNEVELSQENKEKLKSMSPEERAKYQVIGTGMYIKEIQDKYKVEIPYEFWTDMAKIKASGEEVKAYLDKFDEKGEQSMSDLTDYLAARKMSSGKSKSEVSSLLIEAYKEIDPNLTDDEIAEKIIAMKKDMQNM